VKYCDDDFDTVFFDDWLAIANLVVGQVRWWWGALLQ